MSNLWPKDLLLQREDSIRSLLEDQAATLPAASDGRLHAEVIQRLRAGVFVFEFRVYPHGRPEHSYELFRLRAPNGHYPVAVEAQHLDNKSRVQKANEKAQLETLLKAVFEQAQTREVLGILAADAAEENSDAVDGSPVQIGARLLKDANGNLLATASFFGVASFIDLAALRLLVGAADTPDGPYKTIGGNRFVATVPVAAPLKMTLTRKQVDALQQAARISLSTEESAR